MELDERMLLLGHKIQHLMKNAAKPASLSEWMGLYLNELDRELLEEVLQTHGEGFQTQWLTAVFVSTQKYKTTDGYTLEAA